jgi:hypothetical protein
MTGAWERSRRRHRLVEDVLARVARRGAAEDVVLDAAVAAEYGDEGLGGLLRDVQRRWDRAFEARLDVVLETTDARDREDLRVAVAQVWSATAAQHPAARTLLDAHRGHPALRAGHRHTRRLLLAATGLDLDDVTPQTAATDTAPAARPTGAPHVARTRRARRHCPGLRSLRRGLQRRPVPAP